MLYWKKINALNFQSGLARFRIDYKLYVGIDVVKKDKEAGKVIEHMGGSAAEKCITLGECSTSKLEGNEL